MYSQNKFKNFLMQLKYKSVLCIFWKKESVTVSFQTCRGGHILLLKSTSTANKTSERVAQRRCPKNIPKTLPQLVNNQLISKMQRNVCFGDKVVFFSRRFSHLNDTGYMACYQKNQRGYEPLNSEMSYERVRMSRPLN